MQRKIRQNRNKKTIFDIKQFKERKQKDKKQEKKERKRDRKQLKKETRRRKKIEKDKD